jgi:galactonate dehydratase
MRVVAVETIEDPRHPALLWLRVHTDTEHVGLGETGASPKAAAAAVHGQLAGLLVGEDPLRIEEFWHRAFRALNFHGSGGAELRALSAIDIALWDLLGKAADMPLHAVLGGACREAVPIYNTCGNYGEARDRDRFLSEPGELARELLDSGIRMMKVWPFDDLAARGGSDGQFISRRDIAEGVACVAAIRERVGDEMEIAIEGHSLWSLPAAIRIAQALEPHQPIWLEDMLWPDDPAALAQLRAATRIPLIASERLLTRWRFRELLEQGAVQIAMLDIAWTGGISEARKIATLASVHQIPVAPHNCGGPVNHVANLHFCASIPNLYVMETVRAFYGGFFGEYLTTVPLPVDGRIRLPDGPGLGTELRPELLGRADLVREVTSAPSGHARAYTGGDPWTRARF